MPKTYEDLAQEVAELRAEMNLTKGNAYMQLFDLRCENDRLMRELLHVQHELKAMIEEQNGRLAFDEALFDGSLR